MKNERRKKNRIRERERMREDRWKRRKLSKKKLWRGLGETDLGDCSEQ